MKLERIITHRHFTSAAGSAVSILAGLLLWLSRPGEGWVRASYDYLFRFSARADTNQLVLVLMDNSAHDALHQKREQRWDRALHAQLLNKLADDGCRLVVFDVFLEEEREEESDQALAAAMRRLTNKVVLVGDLNELPTLSQAQGPVFAGAILRPPHERFRSAAAGWGVGRVDQEDAPIVRRHWPFPAPDLSYPSLPWKAAATAGTRLEQTPVKQWLRYYGRPWDGSGGWTALSYQVALSNAPGMFSNKVVFIGRAPKSAQLDGEEDEFGTPYTRWTGQSAAGVEILATEFLNLVNRDWLRRPAAWIELILFLLSGALLGGGLVRARLLQAVVMAAAVVVIGTLASIALSHFTNYWFPWLVLVAGQVPCALLWALAWHLPRGSAARYELAPEPFGTGSYGEVYLARDRRRKGEWVALKKLRRASFNDPAAYEREFSGVARYLPISTQHPDLLRIFDFTRDEREQSFYYVMELSDAVSPDWEKDPVRFKPCDLAAYAQSTPQQRPPVPDCVRIGLSLAEALAFLHSKGLIHRDIKPKNILFVAGRPKLADVGLVAEIPFAGQLRTQVGTWSYMPPPPEPHGTRQADIYSLGMVLYEISTGRKPGQGVVSDLPTALVESEPQFIALSEIFSKACAPDLQERYQSADEMAADLRAMQSQLTDDAPTQPA